MFSLRTVSKALYFRQEDVMPRPALPGCGSCRNDLTVAPEDENPNPCVGCKDGSNWTPRIESLSADSDRPGPHASSIKDS